MLLREYIRTILLESDESAEDPLVDVIKSYPQFKIVSSIPSATPNKPIIYISSGARSVRYTLRTKYLEAWQSSYSGETGYNERDHHIGTLGTNKNIYNVVLNALKLAGEDAIIYYAPITLGARAAAGPRGIIKFGKYKGINVSDLADTDPGYVAWLYTSIKTEPTSFLNKPAYKTFREEVIASAENNEQVMAIVNKKIAKDEEIKRQAEKRVELQKKNEEIKALSKHEGVIGKRQNFLVTYIGSGSWRAQGYGYGGEITMYAHKFRTDDGNTLVWMTQNPMGVYVDVTENDGYTHQEWKKYENGQKFKIAATPKEHSEYKGEKQTKIARVKIISEL